MSKLKAWLSAARLRTLPLSVSGVLMGASIAKGYGYSDHIILILALLTTVGFQITSNFANDYGDGIKGTDNHDRIGPLRALQSGSLNKRELKKGIRLSVLLSFVLALALVLYSFRSNSIWYILLFIFLGIVSIWASISYTVGDRAYGYKGLGDLFVFCFFGLLGVLGSMFLFTKFLTASALLPAIGIGLLSTAVLNLNNLRDLESDRKAGKNTIVVALGIRKGKKYHYLLILAAFGAMLAFSLLSYRGLLSLAYLLAFVPLLVHLRTVYYIREPRFFDPELKKVALSTFMLALLCYLLYNNFL